MANHNDHQSVRAEIDHRLMMTFSWTLDASGLPPMTVMRMMASALGAIYRQSANSHLAQQCPCGWQPVFQDIEALQSEMEMAARQRLADSLRDMPAVGRA